MVTKEFSFSNYKEILLGLGEVSEFDLISNLRQHREQKKIYIRHDVDFFLNGWEKMPKIENELGVKATYYICLTQHYNVFLQQNQQLIKNLLALGHEIGLHYDLVQYPQNHELAEQHLQFEINVLETLFETKIKSIVMHQPFLGTVDWFKNHKDYINPMSEEFSFNYVSDSCRLWRDDTLFNLIKNGHLNSDLLFNTHPEVWINNNHTLPEEYVYGTLIVNAVQPADSYFKGEVLKIWKERYSLYQS